MKVTNNEYDDMTKKASPNSPKLLNMVKAFCIGGLICVIGQLFKTLYTNSGLSEKESSAAVTVTLIAITAILTGIGIFDKIAKHAGAGTIVPITGFANAVVSPALEFKAEGHILGTGAKIFTIAGPVIAYGCASASVYGLIYYLFCM
ncbi:MAG: stage V sporulation protein AC [Clostridiales bacterium]|nr:stage V sporulation protein AC [Clostridiales bacterium]